MTNILNKASNTSKLDAKVQGSFRAGRYSLSLLLSLLLSPFSIFGLAIQQSPSNADSSRAYSSTPASQSASISSQAELNEIIIELNDPSTRSQALGRLAAFAADRLCQVGSVIIWSDPKTDELKQQAARAVLRSMDRETVSQALDSTERTLQLWGIRFWRTGIYEPPTAEISTWLSLMPKVMKLAVEGDETIREAAAEKLQQCEEAKAFLQERSEVETSSWVLVRLVPPKGENTGRFNTLLLGLLLNPREQVRAEALTLIGSNDNRAPVNQIDFDNRIFDRVIELTRSESEKERSGAAYALTAIRMVNLDESRETFARLSKDTSSEVRCRVGYGLAGLDGDDVKVIISNLANDSSSLVQVMTISAVGPKKFVEHLKRLARDSDPQAAAFAAGMLKRLIQDGMRIPGVQ